MKCTKCHKPLKEDTDGDVKYCQGHSPLFEFVNGAFKRVGVRRNINRVRLHKELYGKDKKI